MDTEEKKFTESEAHRHFAIQYHGKTWDLLDKNDRTAAENEKMLDYAHTSLAHWRVAGTAVHHHRGEWMLSRVHAVLGNGVFALQHARRAYEIHEAYREQMQDFDAAFAYEALARAHAAAGELVEARKFLAQARQAGEKISGAEDREIFFAELSSGNWYGVE